MKRETTGIMTDLSDDDLIRERFRDEHDRVIRWARKTKMQPLEGYEPKPAVFTYDGKSFLTESRLLGFHSWTSPKNGDTWICVKRRIDDYIYSACVYFWNTIGSIGFMKRETLGYKGEQYKCISTFSSHAMLRYRDRLCLQDLSPFQLVLRIENDSSNFIAKQGTRGDGSVEAVCEIGVFRGVCDDDADKQPIIIKYKTFIPFDSMDKKMVKSYEDDLRLLKEYKTKIDNNGKETDTGATD